MSDDDLFDQLDTFRTNLTRNYFTEYSISPFDNAYYNDLFNNNKVFKEAMNKNISQLLGEQIDQAVKLGSNQIIQINAKPFAGKSVVAQKFGVLIALAVVKYKSKDPNIFMSFDTGETVNIIKKMENFDICIQDEIENLEGENGRAVIERINNLLRTIRATQKFFIFCSPVYEPFDAVNFVIEPIGKYTRFLETGKDEDMITRALVFYPDKDHKMTPIGYVELNVSCTKYDPHYKDYLKQKMDNIERLQSHGGFRGATYDEGAVLELATKLYEYATEHHWTGKKVDLVTYIKEMDIPGNYNDVKHLITKTMELYNTGNSMTTILKDVEKPLLEACLKLGIRNMSDIRTQIISMYPDMAVKKVLVEDLSRIMRGKIATASLVPSATKHSKEITKEIAKETEFIPFATKSIQVDGALSALEKQIASLLVKGMPFYLIAEELKRKETAIREKGNSLKTNLIANYAVQFVAIQLGVVSYSKSGEKGPDVVDHNNIAWSVKYRNKTAASLTLNAEEECSPERKWMEDHTQDHFMFVCINAKWTDVPRVTVVRKEDPMLTVSDKSQTIFEYLKSIKYEK